MKTLFYLAILVGFGGTLAAAHYVPWVSHTRLPSQTTVVANGGRAERFLIHLPADRISATDGAGGLRATTADGLVQLPARLASQPLLVEHFKVRDGAGNVIGVAARHWAQSEGAQTTAWSLLIPSRGVLLLTAPGETAGALDTALERAGYNTGTAWSGDVAVALGGSQGIVAGGTGEFDGFGGQYTESWRVTGVGVPTDIRGTIELDTVMSRGQGNL